MPRRQVTAVHDMARLMTALYCTHFKAASLQCAPVAREFQRAIRPNVRSHYLLWLRRDAKKVLKAMRPWGPAMFCGDVVESLNALLKECFLMATTRGEGRGSAVDRDTAMLQQPLRRVFLARELPRWLRWQPLKAINAEFLARRAEVCGVRYTGPSSQWARTGSHWARTGSHWARTGPSASMCEPVRAQCEPVRAQCDHCRYCFLFSFSSASAARTSSATPWTHE